MANWWDNVVTNFGTKTDIWLPPTPTHPQGYPDIEKGAILGVPAGTQVSLPVAAQVDYADPFRAVVEIPGVPGYVNIMHIGNTLQAGEVVPARTALGTVEGSGPEKSSNPYFSGYSSGGVIEFGSYSTLQGAINRDNPNPYDFTGINNPQPVIGALDYYAQGQTIMPVGVAPGAQPGIPGPDYGGKPPKPNPGTGNPGPGWPSNPASGMIWPGADIPLLGGIGDAILSGGSYNPVTGQGLFGQNPTAPLAPGNTPTLPGTSPNITGLFVLIGIIIIAVLIIKR